MSQKSIYRLVPVKATLWAAVLFSMSCNPKDNPESSFEVQLSGNNQVPVVNTQASGVMRGTYNRDTKILTYDISWQNLSGGSSDPNVVNLREVQISGANQVTSIVSPGSGSVRGSYNRGSKVLAYSILWRNLTGGLPPSVMHFHGPAAPTANAPVVVGLMGFPQQNTLSGDFVGTTRALTDAEESDLLGGRWYYNLHTTANPSGELRGQLVFVGVPTMMHFHGPAATTANAGVQFDIQNYQVRTTGTVSGQTQPLTAAQEADLLNGLWYFNLHTNTFPSGELRGQIVF
jgi:CHRD domain